VVTVQHELGGVRLILEQFSGWIRVSARWTGRGVLGQYWASGGGSTGTYLYCSEVLAPSAWLGMSRPRCTANAALTLSGFRVGHVAKDPRGRPCHPLQRDRAPPDGTGSPVLRLSPSPRGIATSLGTPVSIWPPLWGRMVASSDRMKGVVGHHKCSPLAPCSLPRGWVEIEDENAQRSCGPAKPG